MKTQWIRLIQLLGINTSLYAVVQCFLGACLAANLEAPMNSSTPETIQHLVLVVLENTPFDEALQQPFLKQLSSKGALLTNYSAVSHPSYPNYVAMISGSTQGIPDDIDIVIRAKHLGDLLEAKGKDWRVYAENFPGNCFRGIVSGPYAKRHVPFLSFKNVFQNRNRCKKITSAKNFTQDIHKPNFPEFALYIPNVKNDGHDTGVAYADKWLAKVFGNLLSDPSLTEHTLFVITFDEDNGLDNNRVYTLFYGAGVQPGATSKTQYNHYSLLKTIETIFKLDSLGQLDEPAFPISGIWKN